MGGEKEQRRGFLGSKTAFLLSLIDTISKCLSPGFDCIHNWKIYLIVVAFKSTVLHKMCSSKSSVCSSGERSVQI